MNTAQHHPGLWSLDSLTRADVLGLLDAACALPHSDALLRRPLRGKNVALMCDARCDASADASAQDRCEAPMGQVTVGSALANFKASATALGAHVAHIDPRKSRIAQPHESRETAVMLGRLYDAIDCEDMPAPLIECVEHDAGKPVFSGLSRPEHPAHVMADLLTMRLASGKALSQLTLCVRGDPQSPQLDAWLQLAALSGLNLYLVGPPPSPPRMARAQQLAQQSGARIACVKGVSSGDAWANEPAPTAAAAPRREQSASAPITADFFWDEHSPSRCLNGRPQLRSLHPLAAGSSPLAEAQVVNQGLIFQALLLSVLG